MVCVKRVAVHVVPILVQRDAGNGVPILVEVVLCMVYLNLERGMLYAYDGPILVDMDGVHGVPFIVERNAMHGVPICKMLYMVYVPSRKRCCTWCTYPRRERCCT